MTPRGGLALLTGMLLVAGCGLARMRPADPLTAEEHNDLGVAYYARGDYGLAARAFRRAATLRPGWTRALANLGDASLALGELGAAIDAYELALKVNPVEPAVANNLAWALLQHPRRWPEAEPVIRGALARDPEPRGYYLDTLGLLLLKKGELHDALGVFRAALADTGLRDRATRALVLRHTGEAHARLGDVGAAERCERLARGLSGAGLEAPRLRPAEEGEPRGEVGGSDTLC